MGRTIRNRDKKTTPTPDEVLKPNGLYGITTPNGGVIYIVLNHVTAIRRTDRRVYLDMSDGNQTIWVDHDSVQDAVAYQEKMVGVLNAWVTFGRLP